MHIVKIKGLYDSKENIRSDLIPIESYSVLTKKSGIDPFVHKKTNVRLNKSDMLKIQHLK